MAMKYVIIYFDCIPALKLLNDEERGRLFLALMEYGKSRSNDVMSGQNYKPENLTGNEKFLFEMIKAQMGREEEKYQALCKKNKENVQRRWERQNSDSIEDDEEKTEVISEKNTSVYDRIRPLPTYTYNKYKYKYENKYNFKKEKHSKKKKVDDFGINPKIECESNEENSKLDVLSGNDVVSSSGVMPNSDVMSGNDVMSEEKIMQKLNVMFGNNDVMSNSDVLSEEGVMPSSGVMLKNDVLSNSDVLSGNRARKPHKAENRQEIVDSYNSICIKLAQVAKITNKRARAIDSILAQYEKTEIFKVFGMVNESQFLTGINGGWRANFDWLMKVDNFQKVLEGNYTNRTPPKTAINRGNKPLVESKSTDPDDWIRW